MVSIPILTPIGENQWVGKTIGNLSVVVIYREEYTTVWVNDYKVLNVRIPYKEPVSNEIMVALLMAYGIVVGRCAT